MTENSYLEEDIEDTQKNKYLTFSLGEEFYGVDIMFVTEIVGLQPINMVPELPSFVKGVINLRGDIIPVMDARLKFKKAEIEYNDRTCIIVIEVREMSIGLVVDAVNEVLTINQENVVPPPRMFGRGRRYIQSIGKKEDLVILILSCDELLNEDEIEAIQQP